MRKSIILVIALGMCGALCGEAWAAKVNISGRHSQSEIQATCGAVGGDFFTFPSGQYGCSKLCDGGICEVTCSSNGNCTGNCPACGGGDQPVLRGSNEVTRVLNNLRTAKRYPAKRY